MKFKRRVKRIAGKIDLVPFLDVIFLLLIFFVVSSRFMFQSAIGVDLPAAVTPEVESQDNHTVILTKSGPVFFDGKKVSMEGLNFGLELAIAKGRDPLLIVKADKEVVHGRVIEIMELAKQAGIKKVALATEPKR